MKKEFIVAYMWLFGTTKKKAEEVYKTAGDAFIRETINAFSGNARRCFYED